MKTHFKILIVMLIMVNGPYVFSQFYLDVYTINYGSIGRGQQMQFSIKLIQQEIGYKTYSVSIVEKPTYAPWITIDPEVFALGYPGEEQLVTFSGIIPNNWDFGEHFFFIDFNDVNDPNYFATASINYTVTNVGIEDYITITQYDNSFSIGDPLHCHSVFTDAYPTGDHMTGWNLKMEVFPSGQVYTYANLYELEWPMYTDFYLTAGSLPGNQAYVRNSSGQVLGSLKVWGTDNVGYSHSDQKWFGINKEPDPAFLVQRQMDGNSIHLYYYGQGATEYLIYYASHPGPPYDGTGASQGPSPISAGSSTDFVISGLPQCTPYYFTIIGSNSFGNSVYSDESKILFFTPENQQPVDYFLDDVHIVHDFTYNSNMYFAKNLIIESGYTLDVSNCMLFFDSNSKLVIEPGAKLILNNATLTSPCNQSWLGIEVWGNSSQHQFTISGQCSQGIIELNGTVVENAYNSITLWHPGDWSSMGGIIKATNSTFKNNRRAIEFMSYHNYNPYNPQIQMSNLSFFSNCVFETNDNYIQPNPFYTFISMWDVEGIKINGCTFKNLKTFNNNSNRGYGIYTIDAKYSIQNFCTSPMVPCPVGSSVRSEFEGLYAGIDAMNSMTTKTISVNNAIFRDNSYGIKLDAVSNSRIIFNDFFIGPNTNCPDFTGIGVQLDNCNGYSVEENTFTYSNSWPIGAYFMGIRVLGPQNSSNAQYNEIYRNTFNGITAGNVSEGSNGNLSYPFDGLCYICNQNQSNTQYDFYVKNGGIGLYQGSNDSPAGNIFSHTGSSVSSDFNNEAGWLIDYYFYLGNPGSSNIPGEEPLDFSNLQVTGSSNQNQCLSHYGQGNQTYKLTENEITTLTQQFADNSIAYDNVLSLYNLLKDGGSTEDVIEDIESSDSTQTMELRDELLGSSPHLSQEVLLTAIDNYDVLPDPILFEILSANPDELRNENLMTYLDERTPPMPEYMIELLYLIAYDTTYKTSLQRQIAYYHANMTRIANTLLRDMIIDTVTELYLVRNWLDNLQNLGSDYQIIDSYLEEGDVSSAMTLVNMLPTLYTMNTEEQAEYDLYEDLKTIQSTMINEGKNIFELNQEQISNLDYIAQNSQGIAGVQARNILSFAYGYVYINCGVILPPSNLKSVIQDKNNLLRKIFEPKVFAYPNPANNWTSFYYDIPTISEHATLRIINLKGQTITEFSVEKNKGQILWDTRKIIPGLYLFTLSNGKYSASGKIEIIH